MADIHVQNANHHIERTLLQIHLRLMDIAVHVFPITRVVLECLLIVIGPVLVGALISLHAYHIQDNGALNCFPTLETDSIAADILLIEINGLPVNQKRKEHFIETPTGSAAIGDPNPHPEATFGFNSTVTCGSFLLSGYLREDNELWLEPISWINKPEGFWMVSIYGQVNLQNGTIFGLIPECGGRYRLDFVSDAPSNSAAKPEEKVNQNLEEGSYLSTTSTSQNPKMANSSLFSQKSVFQGFYFCNYGYHLFRLNLTHVGPLTPPGTPRARRISATIDFMHFGGKASLQDNFDRRDDDPNKIQADPSVVPLQIREKSQRNWEEVGQCSFDQPQPSSSRRNEADSSTTFDSPYPSKEPSSGESVIWSLITNLFWWPLQVLPSADILHYLEDLLFSTSEELLISVRSDIQMMATEEYLERSEYRFAKEMGYLMMPQRTLARHKITVHRVSVSAFDQCLGPEWMAMLFAFGYGYDTILIHHMKRTFPRRGGFLQSINAMRFYEIEPHTNNIYYGEEEGKEENTIMYVGEHEVTSNEGESCGWNTKGVENTACDSTQSEDKGPEGLFGVATFNFPSWSFLVQKLLEIALRIFWKFPALAGSALLVIVITCFVSIAQQLVLLRMLDMAINLQFHRWRARNNAQRQRSLGWQWLRSSISFQAWTDLALLLAVVCGLRLFLLELFSDGTVAEYFLILVWCSDWFMRLTVRSEASARIAPRLLGLYLYVLTLYLILHPEGFHGIALLACSVFILHAMLHLVNKCEVPAFVNGNVTARNPRLQRRLPGGLVTFLPGVAVWHPGMIARITVRNYPDLAGRNNEASAGRSNEPSADVNDRTGRNEMNRGSDRAETREGKQEHQRFERDSRDSNQRADMPAERRPGRAESGPASSWNTLNQDRDEKK
mmetsp:Transcript_23709/g.57422  ORF Transcript_23709/g.57422 Transcript_23709/m.57422 type:complete len:896 (+) Transcript_23709:240-2927(+)|eukprot:CAMPEP_0114507534 /NCGR_PEP_ID=MMETSP0109-20121206/12066_1 /TAXON_ID=29199 /ORGANISM="Chlorarachnion reptans, Strain CCCM449" /LENGTH=895 /DNA_ID=CAMNT_0001686303 /DNA_START=174 /DNA_END=2861 /DNA_ORIENTATION=+